MAGVAFGGGGVEMRRGGLEVEVRWRRRRWSRLLSTGHHSSNRKARFSAWQIPVLALHLAMRAGNVNNNTFMNCGIEMSGSRC